MVDPYASHADAIGSPARFAAMVTPADADFVFATKAIMVGTPGTLVVTMVDDTVVTIPSNVVERCPVLSLRVKRIAAASTASEILVVW